MKNLLKVLLISSSLCACNNSANENTANDADTSAQIRDAAKASHDNGLNNTTGPQNIPDPTGFESKERETTRQITSALLSSKKEISLLQSEISDSLTRSGLAVEKRSYFVKTIQQLEASTDLINKELENILVTDLQKSHGKLTGIVKKMKDSEKELGAMVARLDKINNYIQVATTLIQTLVPAMPPPVKKQPEKIEK
jgi:SepF-like predicted cell division protein (DUF552 family)